MPMAIVAKRQDRTVSVFEIVVDSRKVLGRSSSADYRITEEHYMSREHAVIIASSDALRIERLESARNPIFFNGKAADIIDLSPGQFFVIGATEFHFMATSLQSLKKSATKGAPADSFHMTKEEVSDRGSGKDRLRLLDLMELPEVLRSKSRMEFYVYACGVLRMAANASWVRVLTITADGDDLLAEDAELDVDYDKPMSEALVKAAVDEPLKPIVYSWKQEKKPEMMATKHDAIDWAISCAMTVPGEDSVLFYLAGTHAGGASPDDVSEAQEFLRNTGRLVGLVADSLSRAMSLQKMETWETRLERFFPKKIAAQILGDDAEDALAPKIAEATVMFFDIRGFSRMAEENLSDILKHQGALRRVMTAMTQCVFDEEGVVLRYMGDGILAVWNVPFPLENHVQRACMAALDMTDKIGEVSEGWKCGIGIGVGDVVAGSLGSEQVYAFDIVGAIANQTARVEGTTKMVGVPILVTDEVVKRLPTDSLITRRVARVLPVGMDTEMAVHTIHRIPEDEGARKALEARLDVHAQGLAAFEKGHWQEAFDILLPIVQSDPASKWVFGLAHVYQGNAPREWRGVIELSSKG